MFGQRLKAIRKFRHMTQKELGKKIGVLDAKIRQYELGLSKPKFSTLQALADALEVGTTVLTDIDMTTLGDIKSLLFQLDQQVGIKLIGEPQGDGTLKEGTISIAFDNEYINTFLKEWADKRLVSEHANYEYELLTQYDSGVIVAKDLAGEYKDFLHKAE